MENIGKYWKIEGFPILLLKTIKKPSIFQLFCIFQGSGWSEGGGDRPKTLENWKIQWFYWKILENIGKYWKIEGFPILLLKTIKKPLIFQLF